MNFGLLFIIPAIGGYWFLNSLHRTRHQLARGSGYHTLFQSAVAGGLLFGFAHLAIIVIHRWLPQFAEFWQSYVPYTFSDTAALGILLSVALPVVGNRIWTEEKSAQRTALEGGDHIELIISESIDRQSMVEITLRTRKSYIGFALKGRMVNISEPDISIIPLASGYRNKETLELEITTNYAPVIEDSELDYADFQVVIPKSEIVSVRLFDPEIYRRFQGGQHQGRRRGRR